MKTSKIQSTHKFGHFKPFHTSAAPMSSGNMLAENGFVFEMRLKN